MDLKRVAIYDPLTDSDIAIDSSGSLSVSISAEVGALSNLAVLSANDTIQQYTITSGKTGVIIQNRGSNAVVIGGSGVTYATGFLITPMMAFQFQKCKSTFSFYYRCDTGKTTSIAVVENV